MVTKAEYEALMKRLNALENGEETPKGKSKKAKKTSKNDLSGKSYQDLQKIAKKRGIKANQSKDALIEALNGSTEEWETVKENVLKREGRPVAYALIQKNGKKRRAVIGGYCSIPASKITEVKDYFIKHTYEDKKGKKIKAYYVPLRKGSVVLLKDEVSSLIKGF